MNKIKNQWKIVTGQNRNGEWTYVVVNGSFRFNGEVWYETQQEAIEQGQRARNRLVQELLKEIEKRSKLNVKK